MSNSKKKNYKKRKQAPHTSPKQPRSNVKSVKQPTKFEKFMDDWLWLITIVALVIITALIIIFIPKLDSCTACDNCGKKPEVADTTPTDVSRSDISSADLVSSADNTVTTTASTEATTTVATTTTAADNEDFDVNKYTDQFKKPADGEEIAVLDTTMGVIKMRLFPEAAPKSVENFKKHITDGYYNGVIFHRVMNDFMIQGGDPTGTGRGGESIWGGTFEDEFENGYYNFRGALSMANTGKANTNSSQFFIVQTKEFKSVPDPSILEGILPDWAIKQYSKVGGYPLGDHELYPTTNYLGHTVFGQVFEGMDVVDAIAAVKVDANDKPESDVVINSARLEKFNG